MTADPRAALATLVSALERHLEAAAAKHGENDPVVYAAYQDVAVAFDGYDDALLDAYDEVTPLEVYSTEDADDELDDELEDDDEDDEDDETDDDSDDDSVDPDALENLGDDREGGTYQGLDDEEYDEETPSVRG